MTLIPEGVYKYKVVSSEGFENLFGRYCLRFKLKLEGKRKHLTYTIPSNWPNPRKRGMTKVMHISKMDGEIKEVTRPITLKKGR